MRSLEPLASMRGLTCRTVRIRAGNVARPLGQWTSNRAGRKPPPLRSDIRAHALQQPVGDLFVVEVLLAAAPLLHQVDALEARALAKLHAAVEVVGNVFALFVEVRGL